MYGVALFGAALSQLENSLRIQAYIKLPIIRIESRSQTDQRGGHKHDCEQTYRYSNNTTRQTSRYSRSKSAYCCPALDFDRCSSLGFVPSFQDFVTLNVNRFGDKPIHSSIQAIGFITLECAGGKRNDRRSASDFLLSNFAESLLSPIEHRHLTIHQHQRVFRRQHTIHRLLAIADGLGYTQASPAIGERPVG